MSSKDWPEAAGFTMLPSGYIGFGSPIPATGTIRGMHPFTIKVKSQDGLSDRTILDWGLNGANELVIGVFAANHYAMNFQSGGIAFYSNTSNFFSINNTRIECKRDDIRFQNDLTAPRVFVQDKTSGSAVAMTYEGGGTSAAAGASGDVFLQTRPPGAGGTSGLVRIRAARNGGTLDEGFAADTSGSAPRIGFYGATPAVKPTITGSRGGNAALASLLTQLDALGLITDSSSA